MLYITIVFTLFALMAGMLLLAKTRKEGLGKSFTWISYLVIVISLLMLICQGTRAIIRMRCHMGGYAQEHCMSGMMYGECDRGGCMMMHRGWMNGQGRCMEEMEICKTKRDSACCKGEKKHSCETEEEEEDSVKK